MSYLYPDQPRPTPLTGIERQHMLARQLHSAVLGLVGGARGQGLQHDKAIDVLRAVIAGEEALYAGRDRSLDRDGGSL